MRRVLKGLLWLVAGAAALCLVALALALLALRDLDRAVEEGDIARPLSAPKAAGLFLAAQVLPLRQPGGRVAEAGRVFRDCADCPEMVEIPPGMFLLGSPSSSRGATSMSGPAVRSATSFNSPTARGRGVWCESPILSHWPAMN